MRKIVFLGGGGREGSERVEHSVISCVLSTKIAKFKLAKI